MPSKTPDFLSLIRVPDKPASLIDADAAWHEAVAAREAAQARHIEATRLYRAQVPGTPPTITAREVDEIGEQLAPLFEAEQKAKNEIDRVRADFEAAIAERLSAGLSGLQDAILAELNRLEELVSAGAAVLPACVAAGVKIQHRLPMHCRDSFTGKIRDMRAHLRTRF